MDKVRGKMKCVSQLQKNNPNCCRKIFRNCDGCLTCNSMWYEYVYEKCCNGKGHCKCRVNRWTGKPCVDGVIDMVECKKDTIVKSDKSNSDLFIRKTPPEVATKTANRYYGTHIPIHQDSIVL